MSYSFYVEDTQSLLRDTQALFFPLPQMTRWINLARRQVAQRTGCCRTLITGQSAFGATAQPGTMIPGAIQPGALPGAFPGTISAASANSFQTIIGVERYPYSYANPFARAASAGIKGIVDILSIAANWGGTKPTLDWLPWLEFQAYCRAYNVGTTSYPFVWSTFNDGENGEAWIFPQASTAMSWDWDTLCIPIDIYSDSDYDAIPDGFKNAVKYYVVAMSMLTSQRFTQAQLYFNLFADDLGIARFAADTGKVPSYYWRSTLP